MSGLSMNRMNIALLVAATGLSGAFHAGLERAARVAEMTRAGIGVINLDRTSPTSPARVSSNLAKLRSLDFFRGRSARRHFKGVPMSVAEGKRRARKARNRARHKVHATKARRRA